jgi:hypothetical protein
MSVANFIYVILKECCLFLFLLWTHFFISTACFSSEGGFNLL